jgi:hypothetical protein
MGLLSTLTLAACGSPGSSGTEAPPTNAASAGPGCEPMASDQLILLADDRKLQKTDNVIAAINGSASSPALKAAVDKVADSLDQPKLLALNKAVEIDRKSSAEAAAEFASANNVTAGLSGGSGRVVVGAANFPESLTLAELYKLALNAAGFQATVQQSTNREVYEPALERGEITVFPEYAATLTEFLNKKANGDSAPEKASTDVNATVAALDHARSAVQPDVRQAINGLGSERVRDNQTGGGQVQPQDVVRLRREVQRARISARRTTGVPGPPVLPGWSERHLRHHLRQLPAGGCRWVADEDRVEDRQGHPGPRVLLGQLPHGGVR